MPSKFHHHHHHIRLLEVVKRNRQHTVQKIDVGIYIDIHTNTRKLKYIYTRSRTVFSSSYYGWYRLEMREKRRQCSSLLHIAYCIQHILYKLYIISLNY